MPIQDLRQFVLVISILLCLPPDIGGQSLAVSGPAQEAAHQGEALLTLSADQNSSDHPLALRTAQQALGLWEAAGDSAGIARSYSQIARCYFAQSDLPEAIGNYQKALQLWRDLNNPPEQAEILIMMGFVEARKGEWQNSISFYTQAQGLIDENKEPAKMGQIASGLAFMFNDSGLPENGLIQYQRALQFYSQTPITRDDALTLASIGRTYLLLGKQAEALKDLKKALETFGPHSLDAAFCHQNLGKLHNSLNEPNLALQHLQPALAIFTKASNPREAAQVLALIGQAYESQGQLELGRSFYQRSLRTFIKLSDRLNEAAVLSALGQTELQLNNLDKAEDYLRQSIAATEEIRQVSTSSELAAGFSGNVHERYEKYIECLMRKQKAHGEGDFSLRAFQTSELSRARSLADLLKATETNLVPGLDPQIAQQEKSLRQSLRAKKNYRVSLLGGEYKIGDLYALDAKIKQLETEYNQIRETVRAQYPSYEKVSSPVAWNLQQIQQQVVADDETVLLEYALGSDRSYVWAVTLHDISSHELPSQTVITDAAEEVYRLLKTPPNISTDSETENKLMHVTRELSKLVLSPVAASLNKRRIIVVADGVLNYIPFQILPSSPDSDEPLVATAEVINAPSASILGELREETARRPTPPKVLAAFGDPVLKSNYAQRKASGSAEYVAAAHPIGGELWQQALRDIEPDGESVDSSKLESLVYAKYELANLRELAGPDSLMITSFDATREKLASTDLAKYAILHFATHGRLNAIKPESSGLFLSMVNRDGKEQNGFVGLQDIYSLHAPVELVVLSACQTGLGKDVRGEGLIGLTRGFMYAGASNVVASLWKVDDEATAELMKQFYANMLQRGMTPSAALREAQNSIRRQPQWRSPYYWAAFTLQGESNRVIRTEPRRWTPSKLKVAFGLSLLLLLVIVALWRRRFGVAKRQDSSLIQP